MQDINTTTPVESAPDSSPVDQKVPQPATTTMTEKSADSGVNSAAPRQEPQEFDIPEGEDFFLGKDKSATSRERLKGFFVARVSALRSKPCVAGKGRSDRLILKFELEGVPADPGTPTTAEYECSATWTATSDLQRIAPMILNRPLEKEETNKRFNAAMLRNRKCRLYVTERRTRATGGEPSISTLVINEIQPLDAPVKSAEATAAPGN